MNPTARRLARGMLPTLLAAGGCTGDRAEPGLHVADSAGVQVVTNLQETVPAYLLEDLRLDHVRGPNAGFPGGHPRLGVSNATTGSAPTACGIAQRHCRCPDCAVRLAAEWRAYETPVG
jgi:hypothetical protein